MFPFVAHRKHQASTGVEQRGPFLYNDNNRHTIYTDPYQLEKHHVVYEFQHIQTIRPAAAAGDLSLGPRLGMQTLHRKVSGVSERFERHAPQMQTAFQRLPAVPNGSKTHVGGKFGRCKLRAVELKLLVLIIRWRERMWILSNCRCRWLIDLDA